MYIKEIVLDGFKSFGGRTHILGVDRHFTAVTGLNGSGKSNIVDAICFVMGISNLGQMRASNLSDLIYKNGQASVVSCSATVYFDNSDISQQPVGYERCREIVVSRLINRNGRNKLTINGRSVIPKEVREFFRSIKMNIDKPNFLIMQGRISRMVSMKPAEILAMVEETAGIGIYETKRTETTKLIEKKDSKLHETQTLLVEALQPKMDKLLQDRVAFERHQSLCRDLEFLKSFCVSYQYKTQHEIAAQLEVQIKELTDHIARHHHIVEENNRDILRIEGISSNVQNRIDNKSGGDLQRVRDELANSQKQAAILSGKCRAARRDIKHGHRVMLGLQKNFKDDVEALRQKEVEMALKKPTFAALQQAHASDECAYEEAQRRYDALTQGLTIDEDGNICSLQDQLITTNQLLSEVRTEINVSKKEITHCRKLLRKKNAETSTPDDVYLSEIRLLERLSVKAAEVTAKIARFAYNNGDYESMKKCRIELELKKRHLERKLRQCDACQYELQFSNPEHNFDLSKVHGMVGKLFSVRDKRYSLALSMAADSSIYSYVTDDDVTSQKILDEGQLQARASFMPMNRLCYQEINQKIVKVAQNLVGVENVQPALSLIEYDPFFEPVMKHVFGQTLVCRNLDVAFQLLNNECINCQTVTLEGDIVEADGSITGGSPPKGVNILDQLMEIKQLEEELELCKSAIVSTDKKLYTLGTIVQEFNPLNEKLEQYGQEISACKRRLAHTCHKQREEEIESLERKIEVLKPKVKAGAEKENELLSKAARIKAKLAKANEYRELELKAAFEAMNSAKQKASASRDIWKKRELEYATLLFDIEGLKSEVAEATKKGDDQAEKIVKMETKLEKLKEKSAEQAEKIAKLKRDLKQKEHKVNTKIRWRKFCSKTKQNYESYNQQLALAIKIKNIELNNLKNNRDAKKEELKHLEQQCPWILLEKQFFGLKNTRYDYDAEDPVEAKQKIEALEKERKIMEPQINPAVMSMIDDQMEQMRTLMRQNEILAGHKVKLMNFIDTWEARKRAKISEAWHAVSNNFNGIFSMLLPGTAAKLIPVEKDNEIVGLQVAIALNDVWKESLNELSAGQRSLAALALLLAMLKFSPAPIYVLDEIDACLDMSHTQHIGDIFQAYFPTSQFIVISLKEEMFKNANVLFQTKFQDGCSAVVRSTRHFSQ